MATIAQSYDGFEFTINANGISVTITNYTGSSNVVNIPSTIDGLLVTEIGTNAFANNGGLTIVSIRDSVTNIGSGVFANCSGLTNINVASNNSTYTSVGGVLFNQNQTTLLEFPGGLGGSYTIPNSVTNIGAYAFYDNFFLTNVTIGTGVICIGTDAFASDFRLTSVTIPNSVTNIGSGAFEGCSLKDVTIPLSVIDIGSNAFADDGHLSSVSIPNSVVTIGEFAFSGCGLTSVTIPVSVSNIGIGAFENCPGLTNINVASNNSTYTSVGGVLFDQNQTTLVEFPGGLGGSYAIPDSVTSIGIYAFANNYVVNPASYPSLTSVTIPDNVTNIGAYALYNNIFLTNVTIGGGVISIGDYAFADTGLLSLTIPNSVTNIGAYAFFDCFLTNVTIGSGVISIGDFAFSGELYTANEGGYLTVSGHGCLLSSVTIPDSVSSIGAYAFYNGSFLTNVTIGNGVTSIGDFAFSGVSYDLGTSAFVSAGCPLRSVTIPNSVTNIGEGAFAACGNLTAIAVEPNNPAYASADGVLFNQNQTTLIQFPAGNEATAYTIANSITSIEDYAFLGCTNLASITISDSVTNVGDYSFYDCSALTNVAIGDNVISIGAYAFSGFYYINTPDNILYYACPLANVTIPNSVTSIGSGAFQNCRDLGSVIIGSGVLTIGEYAFSDTSLGSVTIPSSVTSIEDYAFQGCDVLTAVCFPGNAPTANSTVFFDAESVYSGLPPTVYYLPGTTGWNEFSTNTGLSTVLWDRPAPFGYTISNGTVNIASYIGYGGSASIPNEIDGLPVTSIGTNAFLYTGLTSVTIPASVTNIEEFAFQEGDTLTNVYFEGSAPNADSTVFIRDVATAYYLPGTTGWDEFSVNTGLQTALWTLPYPLILNGSSEAQANQFGFTISWATNVPVVVEASTDLSNPIWTPIATNTLSADGTSAFRDPEWTNYPARFYRLRAP